MKILARIGLVLGICASISLIASSGAASVLHLLSRAGWWLPCLVPLHVLPLLLDVAGWRALIPAACRLKALFFIAAVREGINRLLPVANIGGEVIGVQLLIRRGVAAPAAAASIIVETMLTMLSQYIFASVGLVCLVALTGHVQIISRVLLSLALSLPLFLAFGLLLMHGSTFGRLEQVAAGLFARFSSRALTVRNWALLDTAIRILMRDPGRLLTATIWQILGLLAGSIETWLVLRWLGHPVSAPAAIALESLTQAARSIFFLVPAGLGVQEAGLVGLGSLLGIDADVAISLSLAKRLREILFGLPALGVWHWLEGDLGSKLHDRVEL
jgi:putative membrane protein